MSTRRRAYLCLVAALLLGAGSYFAHGRLTSSVSQAEGASRAGGASADNAIPVAVGIAVRGPIVHSLVSTANLRARREVEVATQAIGIVREVRVEEGDFVGLGQVLCSLDDRELRIDLELAQQRLAQTRIQLEAAGIRKDQTATRLTNKRAELTRNEEALSQGLLAESEVTVQRHDIQDLEHEVRVVESTVRESLFRIDELESEIEKVKLQISQASITAPFAGRITERMVELGQSVRAGDRLFRLGTFTPLYADIFVPEQDSRQARPGQRVKIRLGASDAEAAEGVVERISPVVDDETGTVKVTARFNPPSAAFRPGAFVRVEIDVEVREDAVLIPKQSVMEEDGQLYVAVVGPSGFARLARIEAGYQDQTQIQVLSGIAEGDSVVTAGQGKVKDGDRVRVIGG